MAKWMPFLVMLLTASRLPSPSSGGAMEEDEKECAEQLQNLASCIPYVSGGAGKPTPDCCEAAEKVRSSQPKCLCVLIVESVDPSMSLPINTTLALQMPAACHSDAKVSDCPSILKLSPDSPNAKIFKDTSTKTSTANPSSSSSSGSSSSPSGSGSSGEGLGSTTSTKNNGGRLVGLVGGGGVVSLMACISVLFM